MRRLLAALTLPVLLLACGQSAAAPVIHVERVSMSLTDSSSEFGIALLDNLLAEHGAGNVFISPLSATIALSMAASAANPEAKAQILKVLGIDPNVNADEQAKETIARLAQSDRNTQLELAQAVWAQNGLKLNAGYRQRLHDYYQAELSNLDFHDPSAPDVVNGWVDQKTHGKVKKLVDQFDPGTVGYLVNAAYFHSLWATEFKPMSTPIPFRNFDGTTSAPPSMQRQGVIGYGSAGYWAALLPYKGGRFSAVVIVPQSVLSPAGLGSFLTPALWTQTMSAFHRAAGATLSGPCVPFDSGDGGVYCYGDLEMAKFTLDYRKDLTDTLHAMGMPVPGAPVPDFCAACSIDTVVQATRLEVDEHGTTAAAATGVAVVVSARSAMIVDRPFAFAIVDNATDAPLFLGAIGNLS